MGMTIRPGMQSIAADTRFQYNLHVAINELF